MALIKCSECGKEISDTVKKCIYCGYKHKKSKKLKNFKIFNIKKKSSRIIFVFIVILILVSLIFVFLKYEEIKREQKIEAVKEEQKKSIAKVNKNVDYLFSKLENLHINDIQEKSTEISDKVFSGGYYINMPSLQPSWILLMDSYKNLISQEKSIINDLFSPCFTVKNNNCQIAKIYYELDVNNLVGNVKYYNLVIDDYNTWAKNYNKYSYSTGKSVSYLNSYQASEYPNYIDYNNDGFFAGKDDNEKWISSYVKYKP